MSAPSRAVPFYCPYCSDEDLRPFDPTDGSQGHGQWRCRSCRRAFALKYLGSTGGWNETDPPAQTDPPAPIDPPALTEHRFGGQLPPSKGGTT